MADARVTVLIDMKNRLAGLNQTIARFKMLGTTIASAFAPLAGLAAITASIRGTISALHGFETSMLRVKSLTGATGETFASLEAQAAHLGETTQFSASQAADAMGFLAMAGMNTDQIMGAMPDTLNMAAAAGIGLAEAADMTTNILAGYGMKVSDLSRVNDVLANTLKSSNTNMTELAEAMVPVGPLASRNGIAIEDTAAAIGLLANAGYKGEQAGTALRNILARIIEPAGEAKETIEKLGLNLKDAEGNVRPFIEIMKELERTAATDADILRIFGLRAGPALASMLQQGSTALEDLRGKLGATGTASEMAEIQMSGLDGAWKRLKSALEGISLAIGEQGLKGAITASVNALAGLVQQIAAVVRSGRMLEVVGLALEAGFEVGLKKATALFREAFDPDSGMIAARIYLGMARLSLRINTGLVRAFAQGIAVIAALFRQLWDLMTIGAQHWSLKFQNFILDAYLKAQQYNPLIGLEEYSRQASAIAQVQLANQRQIKNGAEDWKPTIDRVAEYRETLDEIVLLLSGKMQEQLNRGLETLGMQTDETDLQVSATERLRDLLAEINEMRDTTPGAGAEAVVPGQTLAPMEEPGAATGLDAALAQATTLKDIAVEAEQSFTGGLSNALSGLITKTQSWGEGLRNIGQSVVGSLIGGFVEMGVEWAKQVTMMGIKWIAMKTGLFAVGQKLKAADSATTAAKGAADTAAMAPAATTASIASFGAAAIIGLALVLAAMAAFGGFASGGYTGAGGRLEPAGIVHRGEFVLPADVTSRIGTGNLYRMMNNPSGFAEGGLVGFEPGPAPVAQQASPSTRQPVQILFLDDPNRAKRLAENPAFESVVVDIAKRNRAEIAI